MIFFRSCFSITLILILIVPAYAQASSILIFGDSLSAGYGIESGGEWASLLQKKLHTNDYKYHVINRSISGETTSGGLERLPAALKEIRPDILIIALGANDGLRGLSLPIMQSNLQSMIDLAHKDQIHVLLIGMHLPSNYGPAFTELFHQKFITLAKDNTIAFLPFMLDGFGENIDLFQADGIHPRADAQPIILDNIWHTLLPLIEKNLK